MPWLGSIDRALGRLIEAGRWLVLPVALILFLQWPLRDLVRGDSREANDLGQWIFALHVSLAMTFATRERTHLAVDAIAHGYGARLRALIARWSGFLCVAPWAAFMIWCWRNFQTPTIRAQALQQQAESGTAAAGIGLQRGMAVWPRSANAATMSPQPGEERNGEQRLGSNGQQ